MITNPPKIFVGTLECGEAEFDQCCQAISSQKKVRAKQFIISNKTEFEAHSSLWAVWSKEKYNFDIFVKIDADTILSRPTALYEIHQLFRNKDITGVQILLQDYFTDSLMPGLNAFSKDVKFKDAKNKLFADHSDYNHNVVLKGEKVRHLAPIGWHCLNPNSKQAFHFGLHRALKKQSTVLQKCAHAWLKNRDNPRAWALLGAMRAGWRMKKNYDYSNKKFENAFNKIELNEKEIIKIKNYALSLIT